jgi:hypothetical protein
MYYFNVTCPFGCQTDESSLIFYLRLSSHINDLAEISNPCLRWIGFSLFAGYYLKASGCSTDLPKRMIHTGMEHLVDEKLESI